MYVKTRIKYAIVGSDFSAQEPRLLAHLSDDPTFKDIFEHDRDPYASISSLVFKKDYWECMEHHEDGTPNPEGAKLRKKAKSILLGILYGMGPKRLSNMLGVSLEDGLDILNKFYEAFPNVRDFTKNNELLSKQCGYVEDYIGRRRHLNDAQLDEIVITANKDVITDVNIIPNCFSAEAMVKVKDDDATKHWNAVYDSEYKGKGYNAKVQFKELAKGEGVDIFDNGAFISKTLTQCTNSRIQSSAATLTKKAMIAIDQCKELNELGFRLLIPIHDELLGECPIEYVDKVSDLLSQCMIDSAKPECTVKMKSDAYKVNRWYADEVFNTIHDLYTSEVSKGKRPEVVKEDIYETYSEFTKAALDKMCDGSYDVLSGEV